VVKRLDQPEATPVDVGVRRRFAFREVVGGVDQVDGVDHRDHPPDTGLLFEPYEPALHVIDGERVGPVLTGQPDHHKAGPVLLPDGRPRLGQPVGRHLVKGGARDADLPAQ